MFELQGLVKKRTVDGIVPWSPRSAVQVAVVFSMFALSGLAGAKTFYVNGQVRESGKGTSWATAYKYLRDALDNSGADDEIYLAKGTYFPDDGATGLIGDRELAFELKGQKLYGGFSGTESKFNQRDPVANPTSLSGAIWTGANAIDYQSLHVVMVNENATLDGLTVENGHANGGHSWNYPQISFHDHGGGCYIKSGKTLTLMGCVFRNNRALQHGGAIMIEGGVGSVVATDCTFEKNEIRIFKEILSFSGESRFEYNITSADSGGGAIYGNVEATDCRFIRNLNHSINFFNGSTSLAYGGAIFGKVTALRCEFTENNVTAYSSGSSVATAAADGGAISGNFTGIQCVFNGNSSYTTESKGNSSGGAISGETVNVFNSYFTSNRCERNTFEENDIFTGGGGAICTTKGISTLANCVFVANTSEFRGGAVQGGYDTKTDSLFVSNCTFLDNAVSTLVEGAALSCGGIVRILNNIFWYTAQESPGFRKDNLINVSHLGAIRNSDENYPSPASAVPNIVKGAMSAINREAVSDLYFVSPSILIVDADPLFTAPTDPDGADNRWGTPDDGLRLQLGSAAIGKSLDPRAPGFVNVLPKDTEDCDLDDNVEESLPVDTAGFVRVQDRYVEIGAYEFGNLANISKIAVFAKNNKLTSGATRNFGKVAARNKKEFTFTIKSVGTNGLSGISTAISGSTAFTLKKANYQALEPGKQLLITVIFRPSSGGKSSAKLRILSSDASASAFEINLTGKGMGKRSPRKSGDSSGKIVTSSGSVTLDADASVLPRLFTSQP